MTPFYSDDWLTLYGGDCREVLAALPSDSVDCVVTSPPYWGLRDYGTAAWVGGDEHCDHKQADGGHLKDSVFTTRGGANKVGEAQRSNYRDTCGKCGATRIDSQLGLERTPEEYVANMVAVFREVRRVLKPSGTCWLNLGDSYQPHHTQRSRPNMGLNTRNARTHENRMAQGLKHKDLVGIPWRVAFALQADGWYLRSDIIWSKPNPMPESVTDRPTKSHEYLFLLTKSSRYYFDADAVREPHESAMSEWRLRKGRMESAGPKMVERGETRADRDFTTPLNPAGRNIRSVWNIATRPYPGAHFAVFPPELPERCIKAGSSQRGVCPECGAPWERTVNKSRTFESGSGKAGNLPVGKNGANLQGGGETGDIRRGPVLHVETTGWRPTCSHKACGDCLHRSHDPGGCEECRCTLHDDEGAVGERPSEPVPAVILDPFGGSGTVGMVANRLSRRAILIDLNPEYLKQQMKRNAQTPLGLDAA